MTSAPIEKRIAFLTAKDCTPEEIEEALAMTDQQSAETSALRPRPGSAGAVSLTEGRHADLCRAQADVLLKVSHAMGSVPRLPGKGGGTEVEARRRAFEEMLKVQARRDVVLFGRRL